QFDDRVGPVMRNVAIPDGLKNRMVNRLANERNAVYRQRAKAWGLAAAAAIFVGLSFVWYSHSQGTRKIDLREHASFVASKEPNQVIDQLRESAKLPNLDFPQELAGRWDFSLLTYYHVETIEGQRVPTLIFTKGATTAKVTLWRCDKVDTSRLDGNYSDTQLV